MTQEEKQLLFKDLCARLPYHPILNWKFINNTSKDEELKELSDLYIWWITKAQDCEVKPYLRPMSSMTEEEYNSMSWEGCNHVINYSVKHGFQFVKITSFTIEILNWLNANHFDYRGLIPMGLALEATKDMYKTK